MNISKEIKNETVYYTSLANLGVIHQMFHEFYEAEKAYSESIPYLNGGLKAIFLSNYGDLNRKIGKFNKSITALEESIFISKKSRNLHNLRIAFLNLGSTYLSMEDDIKAETYFIESLIIAIRINDKLGEARSLVNIGIARYNLGKADSISKIIEGYEIFCEILGLGHEDTISIKKLIDQLR